MKRFVKIRKATSQPQVISVSDQSVQYIPTFLHATIDQTHPVGNKKTFVEHAHNFYHIVLYTGGRGEYSMDGIFLTAEPGTCVLIHPGEPHDFVSRRKKTTYSEITFSFDASDGRALCVSFEELLSLYMGTTVTLGTKSLLSADQMHVLHNFLVRATDHLASADPFSEYHAQYDLTMIFNFLITNIALTTQVSFSEASFERAKEYIEMHYFDQLSMDKLAKIAGVSKGYFFRGFRKRFGVSPLAHQQVIRVEAAKTLLKTTSLRCNEIAIRIGFNNVYFFHRIFKKHVGQTPIQFRKDGFNPHF